MKRYIRSDGSTAVPFNLCDISIKSVVFVSDAREYSPGPSFVNASSRPLKVDYSKLTREQLLGLPKREREHISNVAALRKLHKDELTVEQYMHVLRDSYENKFKRTNREVDKILEDISKDTSIFIFPTQKNRDFNDKIASLGGEITGSDVANIVRMLSHNDYQFSKYSYLDWDWGSELMIFHFNGSYAFTSRQDRSQKIEVSDFNIYIKLDVETKKNNGYVALSFHEPEFELQSESADSR